MSRALLADQSFQVFSVLIVVTDIEKNKDHQLFCLLSVKRYLRDIEAIGASNLKCGASFESL